MSYLVIANSATGEPTYREVDDLDAAVGTVEQLRNDEGVEQARICRLEDVPFEFRPYYRVQVHAGDNGHHDGHHDGHDGAHDDGGHDDAHDDGDHRRGLFGR